jgi:hypothetical protein
MASVIHVESEDGEAQEDEDYGYPVQNSVGRSRIGEEFKQPARALN